MTERIVGIDAPQEAAHSRLILGDELPQLPRLHVHVAACAALGLA